ncbi:MAG TPA: serine protease [bacterium]|nr:serine protease [bacterium]
MSDLMGALVLPRAFVGSGIKVVLPEQPGRPAGRIGFLTAIHVVLPAALSGERFGILLPRPNPLVVQPTAIRFAPRSDAAVLTLPLSNDQTDALDLTEWDPRGHSAPAISALVNPCGFPGSRVQLADQSTQTPGSLELNLLEMSVTGVQQRLMFAASAEDPRYTPSFRGMSGGPVFDAAGELVGINTAEIRNNQGMANIAFTTRADWDGLYHPARHPAGIPGDLDGFPQSGRFRLGLYDSGTNRVLMRFDAIIRGHVYRSQSVPEREWGTHGSIESMEVLGNPYPINIESMYKVSAPEDRTTWQQEFMLEVALILGTMSLVNLG